METDPEADVATEPRRLVLTAVRCEVVGGNKYRSKLHMISHVGHQNRTKTLHLCSFPLQNDRDFVLAAVSVSGENLEVAADR